MSIEITMPKLTDTMTDATLAKWLKKEGDAVKPGDMIAEVETDKATQELETFESGTIAKIVVAEGGKTPVGAVIAVVATAGEDPKAIAAAFKGNGAAKPEASPPSSPPSSPPAAPSNPKPQAQPAIPTPADENADYGKAAVSSTGAPIEVVHGVEDHDEGSERVIPTGKQRVSPLARKIADEKGIDLTGIKGSGPDGRVIKRDVLAAADRPAAPQPTVAPPTAPTTKPVAATGPGTESSVAPKAPAPAAKLETKRIPLTNMRQTIARRLLQSKQQIPHFYVSIDVTMDKLLDLRKTINEALAPQKITVTDLIARAVIVVLQKLPAINASFSETEIIQHGSVNLGIAVSIEDGLVVPVIKNAEGKSLSALSAELKQLADLARGKKLKVDQMTAGTFTISNMGMYGIKNFNAIINPPESAILAVGGTEARPIVKDGQVVPAQVCTFTLSADHRVVDGALGAQFVSELKKVLENPLALLV